MAAEGDRAGMLGIHDYWLFLLTGLLLNLTPGQDTMFIIGRSLSGGLRAGIPAALGISAGSLIHTAAAAIGLSAVLATSPLAFSIVKFAGASYLIYLGARLLLAKASRGGGLPGGGARDKAAAASTATPADPRSAFMQGILTNLLNPKVALFFLAFLPQFIAPTSAAKTLAFLALGLTFITTGLTWCLVLAAAAARLQRFFLRNPNVRTRIDRAIGGLFVALGARLAWSR